MTARHAPARPARLCPRAAPADAVPPPPQSARDLLEAAPGALPPRSAVSIETRVKGRGCELHAPRSGAHLLHAAQHEHVLGNKHAEDAQHVGVPCLSGLLDQAKQQPRFCCALAYGGAPRQLAAVHGRGSNTPGDTYAWTRGVQCCVRKSSSSAYSTPASVGSTPAGCTPLGARPSSATAAANSACV